MSKNHTSTVQSVPLARLVPHPDNPNRMGKQKFARLVSNIELTGRYEPLIVRPCPKKKGHFQIISGHNRARALEKLGYDTAEVIVWEVDDYQAGILLCTLNRLCGSDVLSTKITLLQSLKKRLDPDELAKLLPQSAGQIERLTGLRLPKQPPPATAMPQPMVLFVSAEQQKAIERAMSLAPADPDARTKAAKKAAALTRIAEAFVEHNESPRAGSNDRSEHI
jgi:hypothetical protein